MLIAFGIPPSAIVLPATVHDNTADEAHTLRLLAHDRGWRRVIVATSKYHTRRAGFALRWELTGTGVEVIVRASRYDSADPAHWWRNRHDVQFAVSEAQKLVAYVLGLGM